MASNKQDSSTYTPIQCQIYDYIEIACLHHYQLTIELNNGELIKGKAKTTQILEKQEFLVIGSDQGLDTSKITEPEKNSTQDDTQMIRLDLIKSITVLDKNPQFETVNIN